MSNTPCKKLAIINFSGNVGKSTIAKFLLQPRLNDCEITTVESINDNEFTSDEIDVLRGKEFNSLINSISLSDNFIADIGASNIEVFIEQMIKFDGSHESFDYYIVPVTQKHKQQADTISCIKTLSSIGVPKEKILLVFNQVDDKHTFDNDFSIIISYAKNGTFVLNKEAAITESEFFKFNQYSGKSVEDIVYDSRNFRQLIVESKDPLEKLELSKEMAKQMVARTVKKELDYVFSVLFPA